MLRISRPHLVKSRSRENTLIRNVVSSFTFTILIICLTTLILTSIIADGHWKANRPCQLWHNIQQFIVDWTGRRPFVSTQKKLLLRRMDAIVHSFDFKDEWSFDKAMAAYGCQMFAFLRLGSKPFDAWAGETKRLTITLADLHQQMSMWHGKEAIIDCRKLDVDWAECHILPRIIKSGMMDKVRQLDVKIHFPYSAPNLFQGGQSLAQFTRLATTLHEVENYDMVRFHSKPDLFFQGTIPALNFSGPLAYEMYYSERVMVQIMKMLVRREIGLLFVWTVNVSNLNAIVARNHRSAAFSPL